MNDNVIIKVNKDLISNMKGGILEITIDSVRDYLLENNEDMSLYLESGEHTIKMYFKYLGANCGFSTAKFSLNGYEVANIEYSPPEILAMGGSISINIKNTEPKPESETNTKPVKIQAPAPIQEQKSTPSQAQKPQQNTDEQNIVRETKKEDSIKQESVKQEPVEENPKPQDTTILSTPVKNDIREDTKNIQYSNSNTSKSILIGIIIILVFVIFMLMLMFISSNNSNDGKNTEPGYYINNHNNESTSTPVINKIDDDEIRNIINQYTDYTDFGIYVHNLTNGYEYGYNDESSFLASAMCQVVILDTLSRVIDDKNINIHDEYLYFDYIPNGKEAPSSISESGTYISLTKCIEDVAVYGDNNKSNHLVDYIAQKYNAYSGFYIINSMLREKGYNNTSINRKTYVNPDYIDQSVPSNTTTPNEIANMFEDLVKSSNLGSESYMKNIFKSVSNNGQAIGLKKYVPSYYDVCNVNALTSQVTNNVAIIGDGDTEIVISVLSTTAESMTGIETNDVREQVLSNLIDYILRNQFEN